MKSKYNYVGCQIDDDEFKILSALVMQSGCSSRSEFIRQRIFQKPETDISNKILLEKLLDIESLIRKCQKETYISQKLSSACLQELSRKDFPNYKEMVAEFINRARNEANGKFGEDD